MPNVARIGPYRVFFYSNEGDEPPHVHVEREDKVAKVWLQPVRVADRGLFPKHEARAILALVTKIQADCLQRWNEHFND